LNILCISPFEPGAPTSTNRILPLFYEVARQGHEVDVLFPTAPSNHFLKKFEDKLRYIFLGPSISTRGRTGHVRPIKKMFRPLTEPSFGSLFFPLQDGDELLPAILIRYLTRLRNRDYDVIYTFKAFLRSAGVGLLLGRKWGVPVVLDMEDYEITPRSYLLKRFDGLVVASEELGGFFEKYHPLYIPMSTDLSFFDPSKCKSRKALPPSILWSGIMNEYLNLEVILDAFKLMREEAQLVFMGKGPKRQKLIHYADSINLQKVVFREWVDRSLVPECLAQTDVGIVYVSDTLYERCKCPSKLFEYMAMELPVIATDVGETARTVRKAKCGIIVPPDDPSALANAMNRLVGDAALRHEMGKRGRRYLLEKQNYELLSKRLAEYLIQVSGGSHKSTTAPRMF